MASYPSMTQDIFWFSSQYYKNPVVADLFEPVLFLDTSHGRWF